MPDHEPRPLSPRSTASAIRRDSRSIRRLRASNSHARRSRSCRQSATLSEIHESRIATHKTTSMIWKYAEIIEPISDIAWPPQLLGDRLSNVERLFDHDPAVATHVGLALVDPDNPE